MPIEIILPKFGFTLETADIVQWLKHEGDSVRAGDPICEVTTDKVNMEVEAPEAGTLVRQLFPQGATVPVTQVIAVMLRPGETLSALSAAPVSSPMQVEPTPDPAPKSATPVARRVAEAGNIPLDTLTGTGRQNRITRRDVEAHLSQASDEPMPAGKVRATPAARALAAQSGVDLQSVSGTGLNGRIQRDDVNAAITTLPPSIVAPPESETSDREIVKLAGMRLTIATRLQKSFQTAPHIFFDAQIDTTAMDALRARLKAKGEKVSITSVLVKACAWALLRHPYLNATLDGETITLWKTANIGVAVALDDGLIVPVIQHAEQHAMIELQKRLDVLIERAQKNHLHFSDISDGTFTISNLGMYGVDRFTAIINPPQVAILAVGRAQKLIVPDENDQPMLKSFLQVTLSADHRVVDGAHAALFLNDLRAAVEDPTLLLW